VVPVADEGVQWTQARRPTRALRREQSCSSGDVWWRQNAYYRVDADKRPASERLSRRVASIDSCRPVTRRSGYVSDRRLAASDPWTAWMGEASEGGEPGEGDPEAGECAEAEPGAGADDRHEPADEWAADRG
jgi:hypothetical protein